MPSLLESRHTLTFGTFCWVLVAPKVAVPVEYILIPYHRASDISVSMMNCATGKSRAPCTSLSKAMVFVDSTVTRSRYSFTFDTKDSVQPQDTGSAPRYTPPPPLGGCNPTLF